MCIRDRVLSAPTAFAGDADAGKKVFRKCKACHVADSDKNRVGPSLQGVIGRSVASYDTFTKYSGAMKDWGVGKTWTDEQFLEFVAAPKDVVPGTKMAFKGLKKDEDRANVLAYLKSVAQ